MKRLFVSRGEFWVISVDDKSGDIPSEISLILLIILFSVIEHNEEFGSSIEEVLSSTVDVIVEDFLGGE